MTEQTNESESLGVMIARMKQKQTAKDWNKKSQAEKVADLKKHQAELKKRMEEGKNHTWKSEGHYTKDGKEWAGPQHAHNGKVMTGEKHTSDSQPLYHFKALSKDVQKKVLAKMNEATDSRDGKYTEYQKAIHRADKKREEGKKKATKDRPAHTELRLGQRNGVKAAQLHKQPGYQRAHKHGSKYGPAAPDSEAAKRRKAIERHQERKREKDYWDDDFSMTGCPLLEKLNPSMGIGKYIKDFKKSDAPQFKGASASKRRKMAVAAYLGAKRKKLSEAMAYNSEMGVMDWGSPKGTTYMKDNTPGESQEACSSCEGAGCSHCDYRGTHSRKIEAQAKFAEETEAGETKKKYREDNTEVAPEAGIVPLTKDDLAHLYAEIETMTEDDMEAYGFFDDDEDDDEDELESSIDWEDFDMEEVDIMEVLSVQGRLKRKFSARKNRQKLKVARNIALRRGSAPDRLKKRAVRGARNMVYKRLLKGRDKSAMPPAEKARFERLIGMYKPLIQRFAQRMLPKMRKLEINRMKNRKGKAAQKSKKYKASRPITKASSQKAKKFKVKK